MQLCDKLSVYGFGHVKGPKTPYHYFQAFGSRSSGNVEAHSFDVESRFVRALDKAGYLELCIANQKA
eukprot:3133973-Ditylum_brightwellii.AAC.1